MGKVKLINTFIWFFNILLAFGTIYFALDQIFLATPSDYFEETPQEEPGDVVPPRPPRGINPYAIVALKNPIEIVTPTRGGTSPSPPMELGLELIGTSVSKNKKMCRVMLVSRRKRGQELTAYLDGPITTLDGDLVGEYAGIKLVEVRKEEAVFEHSSGYRWTLSMKAKPMPEEIPTKYGKVGVRLPGGKPPSYNPARYKSRRVKRTRNYELWEIDPAERNYLKTYQDHILNTTVRVSPHSSGGLKLEWAQAGSIALARGLRVGDVVKEVNGIQITSIQQARQLAQDPALQNASTIKVKINRAGRTYIIEYKLKR